jgi:hypothetical protein
MEQPERGRHRRAPKRRSVPLAVVGVGSVGLVALAVAATAVLTDDGPAGTATPAATATVTESASPTSAPVAVTGTRDVQVRRGVVTVVEELSVADGADVVVAPARRSTDPALRLTGARLLAEDGSSTAFDEPVTLGADRTLTVQGTYRLLSCPDLLPVAWPSPAAPQGGSWSRTWTRSSEPLRTGPTLCPSDRSTARTLPGLSARIGGGPAGSPPFARVTLRWSGQAPLALDDIGALSDLAADVVAARSAGSGCPRTGCIGPLPRSSPVTLDIQPVEDCPDAAPRPDRLTLVLRQADGPRRVIAVAVPGLGRWLDRHVCL